MNKNTIISQNLLFLHHMLAKDLYIKYIKPLSESQNLENVQSLMNEYKISHIPIVTNSNTFLGLIPEEEILNNKKDTVIKDLHDTFIGDSYVYEYEHIYSVIEKVATKDISVIAVLNKDKQYLGLILKSELINHFSKIAALDTPGAIIALILNSNDYSLTQISQIVESNNAKILSLYLNTIPESTELELTLKLNIVEINSIIQTFERYNYVIKTYFAEYDKLDNLYKERVDEFIKYINI